MKRHMRDGACAVYKKKKKKRALKCWVRVHGWWQYTVISSSELRYAIAASDSRAPCTCIYVIMNCRSTCEPADQLAAAMHMQESVKFLSSNLVRVPGREFRFLAPTARQHLFLKLNQLILWRRIRICLLSFWQSCECCQTNGFAPPVLRDRVSLATKVTCATAHTKVCSFCPHFRLFCSTIINFSKYFFCSPMIEVRILNRG